MYNIMAACDPGTEPYESWEALDDPSVLSTQIKKMQLASASKNENNSNVVISLPPGLQLSYNHHQQMTIPQQPTVKILKRPPKVDVANESADKPKLLVKSLEQRKQEYAEARLRIMGEELGDENVDDEGASSSGSTKFEVLRQPLVRTLVEDNVIRQPRGPDNTKGFNHRS
ncbi:SUZ domain-containing protein 1 [Adelges cooleyi]|uniref:SUZ domain-containing protein 1 n=1 Tax=Adelges cooleyi TaxID=133065 RepID=UPI00218058BA|nr:SUZ domain-containing protein 1 [Adelges cooleyi]